MRDLIDSIKKLFEGEVVDLKQHKTDKAFGSYADAIGGLIQGEKDFFSQGKFSPFAKSYIESGFDPKFAPVIGVTVMFRDFKVNPQARALLNQMAKERPKWQIHRQKYHKEFTGTKQGPYCMLDGISIEQARSLFENRENSPYGAYCPSRSGFRTSSVENWNEDGIGFNITVGGQDGRRGDKYGNATREEYHIIDNEKDMAEVSHMFALIRRARMVAK